MVMRFLFVLFLCWPHLALAQAPVAQSMLAVQEGQRTRLVVELNRAVDFRAFALRNQTGLWLTFRKWISGLARDGPQRPTG